MGKASCRIAFCSGRYKNSIPFCSLTPLTKFCNYKPSYSFMFLIFINGTFHTSLIQQSLHGFVITVNMFNSRFNPRVANCPLLKILLINSAETVISDNGHEIQVDILGVLSNSSLLNCCRDLHVSSNI